MNFEHVCFRELRAEKAFIKLVKRICPQSPDIGQTTKVYLGLTRDCNNCVIGSAIDVPRNCKVVGYQIKSGPALQLHVIVKFPRKIDGCNSQVVHISCLYGCVDIPRKSK